MIGKVQQFQTLAQAVQFAAQSHQVTSQNLANINTPGFQAKEVSFDELVRQVESGRLNEIKDDFEVTNTEGLISRADGNNVDLDRELAQLKKDALAYQTLTQLLASQLGMMKQAIEG
ncbi:MAG: flagellar basal body rod protein FlgB [Planctomycetota bacterium]